MSYKLEQFENAKKRIEDAWKLQRQEGDAARMAQMKLVLSALDELLAALDVRSSARAPKRP
jgi:hypothetical protein